jgi:hypothetical protein
MVVWVTGLGKDNFTYPKSRPAEIAMKMGGLKSTLMGCYPIRPAISLINLIKANVDKKD